MLNDPPLLPAMKTRLCLLLAALHLQAGCSSTPEYDDSPGSRAPAGVSQRMGTVIDFKFASADSRGVELSEMGLVGLLGPPPQTGPARTTPDYIIRLDSGRVIRYVHRDPRPLVMVRGERVSVRLREDGQVLSVDPVRQRSY